MGNEFYRNGQADEIVFIAAVGMTGEILAPCGVCRELLVDYVPGALIAVPAADGFAVRPLSELHPFVYSAAERRR